jgi:protein TonB
MEPNKILSASILDLLFDERNKEYGAYELRKTYPRRIAKALMITGGTAIIVFTSIAWTSSKKPSVEGKLADDTITVTEIKQEVKIPEPQVPKKIIPPQVRTDIFTAYVVADNKDVPKPSVSQDDLANTKIADFKQDGIDETGLADPKSIGDGKDIVEQKIEKEPDIFTAVEVNAKFEGNWEKFLRNNLNPEAPIDHGAPVGQYKVIIQFVVDLDGNVSDIKPLTNFGYGMEQEAIRVLKKATKWVPANQNGHAVKAYRLQPITFEVLDQ